MFENYDSFKRIEEKQPVDSPVGGPSSGMGLRGVHLRDLTRDTPVRVEDVGSGISQVIPVLTLIAKEQLVSVIEQPELHLHPRAQCALGEILFDRCSAGGVYGHHPVRIIETHSEHIALRILRRIRESGASSVGEISSESVVFYYFKKDDNGAKAHRIRVDSTGRFVDLWPDGFFEERIEELF